MNTPEVAQRPVELCRQGAYETAHSERYAAGAVSIEPEGAQTTNSHGLEAIVAKGRTFAETFGVHGGTVSEPVFAGACFPVAMTADVTPRAGWPRFTMEEIAVYEVRAGKIVREQFFYPIGD